MYGGRGVPSKCAASPLLSKVMLSGTFWTGLVVKDCVLMLPVLAAFSSAF